MKKKLSNFDTWFETQFGGLPREVTAFYKLNREFKAAKSEYITQKYRVMVEKKLRAQYDAALKAKVASKGEV